jgi:hypothetical protein
MLPKAVLVALLTAAQLVSAPTPTGEHAKTGPQIVTDAIAVMARAKDFHVSGRSSIPGVGTTSLNLSVSPTGGGGTIVENGATMQVVVVDKAGVFIKADKHSWDLLTHGIASVGKLLADRWVKMSASIPGISNFTKLTVSSQLIHLVVPGAYVGLATKVGMGQWDGRRAVIVSIAGSHLYVANTGTPYLLHLQAAVTSAGYYNFTDFGDAPMPSAPKTFIPA